jgi:AcrR family transcriptional regulator
MPRDSARREELLERAYAYVLQHGLSGMSLRPLAAAIGSSPRVLLFLFGSKDDLVRALLARARADELALLETARSDVVGGGLMAAVRVTWEWLSAIEHRRLLGLWVEAYAQSLVNPKGLGSDFARQTVEDWLAILATAQTASRRRTKAGLSERTLALAVLRGALLDLLATGNVNRTTAAVNEYVRRSRESHTGRGPATARARAGRRGA